MTEIKDIKDIKFNEVMRSLRKRRGLSLRIISRKTGIGPSNIIRYEKDTYPNLKTIIALANFYNVSLDYLVYGVKKD